MRPCTPWCGYAGFMHRRLLIQCNCNCGSKYCKRETGIFFFFSKVFTTKSWSKTIRLRKLWHHLRNKHPALCYLPWSLFIQSVSQWTHQQTIIDHLLHMPDTISDTGESAMSKTDRTLWPHVITHSLNKHVLQFYSLQEVMLMFRIKKTGILTWDQP